MFSPPVHRYSAPMRRIHTVLLVEDDTELHEAMTAILDAEGYRVIGAYDGQEAIDRLREGVRPSLILLDLMLPRKDGRQFRAEQLADPRVAGIPVIAYSGDAAVANTARALQVRHWFRKPIEFGPFLETVARYCPDEENGEAPV
jgi:CheY-like chemotaxis protein